LAQLPPVVQSDQLVNALKKSGDQLNVWLSKSPANVGLFLENPLAALQAANLDMDFHVMLELEAVLSALARKLDLADALPPATAQA
jgi:hypothetical protein